MLFVIQIKNTVAGRGGSGRLFFIREQEPRLSCLLLVSPIIKQCLARGKGSVNTWRMDKLYLLPVQKEKKYRVLSSTSDSSYLGLPNSRFFKLYLRIIGHLEGLAVIAGSRSQNHDRICII